MAFFESGISSLEPVTTDANYQSLVTSGAQAGFCSGYVPRDESKDPYGSLSFAAPFPQNFLIPRSEWRERIERMEKTGTLLSSLIRYKKLKYQNQARTNYCWAFAFIKSVHVVRLIQGEPIVMLSPASVAAPLTRYANARNDPAGVGGFSTEALAYATGHGIAPVSLWPETAINPKYDNPDSQKARKAYNVPEWYDMPRGSFEHLMSALLRGWPVPIGLGWWGHQVCAIDPIVRGRDSFGVRYRNSWLNFGDDGFGILEEGRAHPNDQLCPCVALPGVAA